MSRSEVKHEYPSICNYWRVTNLRELPEIDGLLLVNNDFFVGVYHRSMLLGFVGLGGYIVKDSNGRFSTITNKEFRERKPEETRQVAFMGLYPPS